MDSVAPGNGEESGGSSLLVRMAASFSHLGSGGAAEGAEAIFLLVGLLGLPAVGGLGLVSGYSSSCGCQPTCPPSMRRRSCRGGKGTGGRRESVCQ